MIWLFRFSQIFAGFVFWVLGKIWFQLRVYGTENLKGLKGPLIVVPNHKSFIDHFLILAVIPHRTGSPLLPIRVMVKDKLFKVPLVGQALQMLGTYPAHRGEGLDVSLAKPLEILQQKGVIGLYPEGGIFLQDGIKDFKRGVGELVRRNPNIPILPVAILGTANALGHSLPRPLSRCSVVFGNPFLVDLNKFTSSEEIASFIREKIIELYNSVKT